MFFTEITPDELIKHQNSREFRYFFPQSGEYAKLSQNDKTQRKILAVKKGENILAYGIFNIYSYKKIFKRIISQYGPIMDYQNVELREFFFDNLIQYFKRNYRVVSLSVNPFVPEKIFEDDKLIEDTKLGRDVHNFVISKGFKGLNKDFYDIPIFASRSIFSKDISEIKSIDLLKNVSQIARYTINKTIKEGILIRDMDLDNPGDSEVFDNITDDTIKRLGVPLRKSDYFKKVKRTFMDKCHIKLAYIDCDLFIEKTIQTIDSLKQERSDLLIKLEEGNVNSKKSQNKLKELDENISIWNKKIGKISKLKEENGNIINISCAVFFESGQDLIYFASANLQKFANFEGPYALNFEMMKYAIENNFKYYNFYGTASDFTEASPDYKVLQFKRNFNGNIEWFMDNYEMKLNFGKLKFI